MISRCQLRVERNTLCQVCGKVTSSRDSAAVTFSTFALSNVEMLVAVMSEHGESESVVRKKNFCLIAAVRIFGEQPCKLASSLLLAVQEKRG